MRQRQDGVPLSKYLASARCDVGRRCCSPARLGGQDRNRRPAGAVRPEIRWLCRTTAGRSRSPGSRLAQKRIPDSFQLRGPCPSAGRSPRKALAHSAAQSFAGQPRQRHHAGRYRPVDGASRRQGKDGRHHVKPRRFRQHGLRLFRTQPSLACRRFAKVHSCRHAQPSALLTQNRSLSQNLDRSPLRFHHNHFVQKRFTSNRPILTQPIAPI